MNLYDETILAIRHNQVTAASAALDFDPTGLLTFVRSFGAELCSSLVLGTDMAFGQVGIGTDVDASGRERWWRFLADRYDADAGSIASARAISETAIAETRITYTARAHEVGVTTNFVTSSPIMQTLAALRAQGVQHKALEDLDLARQRLAVSTVHRLGICLDSPYGAPIFELGFDFGFSAAERSARHRQLDSLYGLIGVSPAQRRWAGAMLEALAPRERNGVSVTLFCNRNAFVKKVRVTYPHVPASLALRIVTGLAPLVDHPGRKLGALMAAAAIPDDTVTELHLTAWPFEPPQVSLTLDGSRLPGIGDT